MNREPSLIVQDLRMDDLRRGAHRRRDHSSIGEKRDEPARPSRVLHRYALPPPGPRALAMMASEAIDLVLTDLFQLQGHIKNLRCEVSRRVRIAADC
jgi:hypothetical protein